MDLHADLSGWIKLAPELRGCERIEAYFPGRAYEPHRHDTYAIGRTLAGVQQFCYRGETAIGLPDRVMVLHPDELHDGQAGTEAGFRYRMAYLEPSLIQAALGGRPLPFIAGGISGDPRLLRAVDALLDAREGLEHEDALYDLAQALAAASAPAAARLIDYRAAERARAFIHEQPEEPLSLEMLEAVAGRDRWRLSRDFRLAFGTSPYRYLVLRRLDRAKALMRTGIPLAQAAAAAGFADQAHMTRHFRKAFGITPGRWLTLTTIVQDPARR
jgi:AraC-like DNA-binding protein